MYANTQDRVQEAQTECHNSSNVCNSIFYMINMINVIASVLLQVKQPVNELMHNVRHSLVAQ